MRIAFVVTHLLGTGHLSRVLTLARACVDGGHDVRVISGGRDAPHLAQTGVELFQLPSLASDGVNFTRLLTDDGSLANEDYLSNRKSIAVKAVTDFAPDVLITELYPFGRRVLREEFRAILNTAKSLSPRPRIYASIRDILAPPSKPAKTMEAEAMIAAFYDGVFVHSDQGSTPLSASWPVTPTLDDKLIYTGYVAPPPASPHPENLGEGEVLVTAGGGDVGRALFETALATAANSQMPWRLLVGGKTAPAEVQRLSALAPPNASVEQARPDFRSMLHHAAASVSMCGYNTAIDLLQSGCPSILVPFDDGGEVEQTLRSESLAKSQQFQVIKTAYLTPKTLAQAVTQASQSPRAAGTGNFDGARYLVDYIESFK